MIRSEMRNRFLKHRSDENRRLFQKQRNKCISLLRKAKKRIFLIIECKECSRQSSLLETILSSKTVSSEKIALIDDDELITKSSRHIE